ncbi:DUF7002 family protein [Paraburkholderia terrae]
MSPDELASIHPRLYHITRPFAVSSIKKHGLLPTSDLLLLFEVSGDERERLETRRRPSSVTISHPDHGEAMLTDNAPLSELALAKCLDDELTPWDWMRMLNQRVFFWVDEENLNRHLAANMRDGLARVVMAFDTRSLVNACHRNVELAAINTGSTIRRPARRGLSTFSPAHLYTYREWQQLRRGRDRIKELTVRGAVREVEAHLIGQYTIEA